MPTASFDQEWFQNTLEERQMSFKVKAKFTRRLYGSISPRRSDIESFVRFHMKIEDYEPVVKKIMEEDFVEDKDVTTPGGENTEKYTYGIKAFYKDSVGIFVGDWAIKACLKQAATGLNLFVTKKGSKKTIAEFGTVKAIGRSLDPNKPHHIHFYRDDKIITKCDGWEKIKGCPTTPTGRVNIVTDCEYLDPDNGDIFFDFQVRWLDITEKKSLSYEDIAEALALSMNAGLFGNRSREAGKFTVLSAESET